MRRSADTERLTRSLLRLSIPFKRPFVTSNGVTTERELLLLRVEDDDGNAGYGEAAPFEPYDGVRLDDVLAALRLRRRRGDTGGPPQAHAAAEMAQLDLDGRRDGRGLAEPGAEAIPVNLAVPAGPPDEIAELAREGLAAGYSCFKLKVGTPDDAPRVHAVREAIGDWPALRLDANGAWGVEQAVTAINLFASYDLQLVEQPCKTLEGLASVRARVDVPIAADESVATPADVEAAADAGACDIVNVKLAASGGFLAAREAIQTARRKGIESFVSSTLDGPWGIGASLQLAASEGISLACGLATLDLFDAQIARALPGPQSGLLAVPEGPGLGVNVADAALAEVTAERL
ncbi:MAG: o-succinylbenzoate synthase [Thermoleophilaceae bacterium]